MKKLNMLTVGMLSALYLAGCNPVDALNEYEQNRFNEQAHSGEDKWIKADSNENIYVPEVEEPDEEYQPISGLSFDLQMQPKLDKFGNPNGQFEIAPDYYENYSAADVYNFINNVGTKKVDMYNTIDVFYNIYGLKEVNMTQSVGELNSIQTLVDIAVNFNGNSPRSVYKYHLDLGNDLLQITDTADENIYFTDLGFYEDDEYYSFSVLDKTSVYGIKDLKGLTSADIYLVPIGFEEDWDNLNTYRLQFAVVGIDNVLYYETMKDNEYRESVDSSNLDEFVTTIDTNKYDQILASQEGTHHDEYRGMEVAEGTVLRFDGMFDSVVGYNSSYQAVRSVDFDKGIVVVTGRDWNDGEPINVLVVKFDDLNEMNYYDKNHDNPVNEIINSYDDTDGSISATKAVVVAGLTAEDGTVYNVFYTNMKYVNEYYELFPREDY